MNKVFYLLKLLSRSNKVKKIFYEFMILLQLGLLLVNLGVSLFLFHARLMSWSVLLFFLFVMGSLCFSVTYYIHLYNKRYMNKK